jgi:iron complex outermembrane recepter protein
MSFRTAAAGLMLASTGVQADTEAPSVQSLPRVEVVGSRVPRIDGETALPVQIIRREEIERSGANTVEQVLGLVSANFGGTNEATSTSISLVSGRSSASLRGLGSGGTLVLLNGRRVANYAFTGNVGGGVDLHSIPLAAIERVEVLKDGASALYGSDAIGGVINFVTRRDFAGAEVFGSYTKTEAGGADSGRATLAAGTGHVESEGFNVLGVLDLRNAERLKGADRSFSTQTFHPELGASSNSADPRIWPANIRIPRKTGGFDIVNLNYPACTSDSFPFQGGCRSTLSEASDLLPSSRQLGFFGTGTLRLSAQADVYAELLASSSRTGHQDPPTAVSTTASQRGTPFVLPASSPYYPTGVTLPSNWSLAYRTVPLGPATTEVESNNVRVLVGLKSRQWDWDLDGAIVTNRTWSKERYVSGMVDAGRLSSAFATGLLNPFGPSGPEGDALLAASELRGVSREASGLTQSVDLRAIRELAALPGGPLGIALGVEARSESLDDAKMPIAFDVLNDTPAAPKQGSRRVQAAYVEIVAPFAKGFEIQAAGRVDHYSDFGTAFSPKLAMRFEPTRGVLLRASAGRGFRAPSLPELYTQQSHSSLELAIDNLTDAVRCPVTHLASDCDPTVDVVTGGNPALHAQRSTQSDLGIVLAPAPGWLASLDLWRIHIDSNITALGFNSEIIKNFALYDGTNVQRGPVDPAFPSLPGPLVRIENLTQNAGDWRVSGVDVSLSTPRAATAVGQISAHLDGTYVQYARQNISAINTVDKLGAVAPRWQHVLVANLDQERWLGTLVYRYRQGYPDANLLPDGSKRHVASYSLWDAQAQFAVAQNVKLIVGVQNLFDTNPPYSNVGDTLLGYDPIYGDPRGRRWTVGLRASWP